MVNDSPMQVSADLYPFQHHYLDIDGLKYHYLDEGNGSPIVMLHGNPTWSFYYRNLIKALKPRYRTVAPDHMGMGFSDKPGIEDYGFRLIDRVDNLDRLISSLKLGQKIILIMHDWGGMIGLTWARKNMDRIDRLIILNSAGFHLPMNKKLPFSLKVCRSKVGAPLIQGLNGFTRAANHWCSVKKLSKEIKDAYLAPHPTYASRLSILKFVEDIPLRSADSSFFIVTETQAALRKMIDIPTLIIWGAKDFVFDDDFYHEWNLYLPYAKYHRIENAGHYVLEDAFDECLEQINLFLAEKRPS